MALGELSQISQSTIDDFLGEVSSCSKIGFDKDSSLGMGPIALDDIM